MLYKRYRISPKTCLSFKKETENPSNRLLNLIKDTPTLPKRCLYFYKKKDTDDPSK